MRARNLLLTAVTLVLTGTISQAQNAKELLKPVCDTLAVRLGERTGVVSDLVIANALRRGNVTDLYFTRTLSQFPWRKSDIQWMKAQLSDALGQAGLGKAGEIFCRGVKFDELETPAVGNDGKSAPYRFAVSAPSEQHPLIEEVGAKKPARGLSGRYIALWQSHGRYFNADEDRWMWQRAPVHRTVEDLYTQSYVIPFLMPMLENAGAFVMSPRERDTNDEEAVCDADNPASYPGRFHGICMEKGRWSDAGEGFSDFKENYVPGDNPFLAGKSRKAGCSSSAQADASYRWNPGFRKNWKGAVYISYRSLPESTTNALYTVRHRGGKTRFIVDQTRGGGTWIYLGTFEMDADSYVELDNSTPAGRQYRKGSVITADAVRFGGGMGKVLRGGRTSGLPAYCEGALYDMVWSGIDKKVYTGHDTDYVNDFASRGPWVEYLKKEKKIPFDISFAFHTDAGVTPNDSTVGTLSIYTLKADGSRKTSDGTDRMTGRALAEMVQSQIVNDIRADFDKDWSRRHILDKSYSESRTNDVPAMLLELLSHQNFSDMKYGLDPAFRFCVSRAAYKGILKFLSCLYGCPYTVQPLPVKDMKLDFASPGKALLTWSPAKDEKEPTAMPDSYIVYTRKDGGAWDCGRKVKSCRMEAAIEKGHIYSFKVVARNEGGKSFPSEILSIGEPVEAKGGEVLIINNFTRVGAPAFMDAGTHAGFIGWEDGGVPYIEDISYIGEVYNFDRNDAWTTDNDPGFGASYSNRAGSRVAGNTFDYPYIHGKAFLELGYPFRSTSASAFVGTIGAGTVDIICGKQTDVFRAQTKEILQNSENINIIISGANIGTAARKDSTDFARQVLGYKWAGSHACPDGLLDRGMEIWNIPNPESYCVENPDGLAPAWSQAKVILRYRSSEIGAGIAYERRNGKSVSFGFPLETLKSEDHLRELISETMNYFEK